MIYIIEGVPGAGKTNYATSLVIKELQKKKGKKVFTNYPVVIKHKHEWKSSFVWEKNYLIEGVEDSKVFLDEAWQYFSSREWLKFTKEQQNAFATNRHNENDYYLIAQHHARLDTIIREIASKFYVVHKTHIPYINIPLWFTVDTFLSEMDVENYHQTRNRNLLYACDRSLPSRKVFRAYDTHFYRKKGLVSNPQTWFDKLNKDKDEDSNLLWDYPGEAGLMPASHNNKNKTDY